MLFELGPVTMISTETQREQTLGSELCTEVFAKHANIVDEDSRNERAAKEAGTRITERGQRW